MIISMTCCLYDVFFFFQAEDGIRDADVTGVQTCALPISLVCYRLGKWVYAKSRRFPLCHPFIIALPPLTWGLMQAAIDFERSEERRVGKECRSWWSP